METTVAVSIQDLPPEIFEIIATYLSSNDLDSCFSTCKSWRKIFNSNKIWKKRCLYPEKYFKTSGYTFKSRENADCEGTCTWKKNYDRQKLLWENWSKGRFTTKKTDICASLAYNLVYFVDEFGNYWLLRAQYDKGITIWKIAETPVFHCKLEEKDQFGIWPVKNKLLTHVSDYIKIFVFKPPENELKLQNRFRFNEDTAMSEDRVNDDYVCSQRFIVVDNFLIGYCENITNLHETYFHIWNCDSSTKVGKQSVFQQSFVDYVSSSTGSEITEDFKGGLLLFKSDSRRFLVNTMAEEYKLCEISLFSLDEMKFINVVARLKSRTAWCSMMGNIVAINHSVRDKDNESQVSVYNTRGKFLAKLDFPYNYNPVMYDEFWLTSSKVILKVTDSIHVVDIVDSEIVSKKIFNTNTDQFILGYVEPKLLLLYDKLRVSQTKTVAVSVWDVETGLQLWNLGNLDTIETFRWLFIYPVYPSKLIVHFTGDKTVSMVDFEK